jgi:hypothetical protein
MSGNPSFSAKLRKRKWHPAHTAIPLFFSAVNVMESIAIATPIAKRRVYSQTSQIKFRRWKWIVT